MNRKRIELSTVPTDGMLVAVIARLRELAQLVQADADNAELISRCRQVEPIEVPE